MRTEAFGVVDARYTTSNYIDLSLDHQANKQPGYNPLSVSPILSHSFITILERSLARARIHL